eukprot:COSAG05_NODE_690_length_7901_cov_174.242886_3_plen_313_part_00
MSITTVTYVPLCPQIEYHRHAIARVYVFGKIHIYSCFLVSCRATATALVRCTNTHSLHASCPQTPRSAAAPTVPHHTPATKKQKQSKFSVSMQCAKLLLFGKDDTFDGKRPAAIPASRVSARPREALAPELGVVALGQPAALQIHIQPRKLVLLPDHATRAKGIRGVRVSTWMSSFSFAIVCVSPRKTARNLISKWRYDCGKSMHRTFFCNTGFSFDIPADLRCIRTRVFHGRALACVRYVRAGANICLDARVVVLFVLRVHMKMYLPWATHTNAADTWHAPPSKGVRLILAAIFAAVVFGAPCPKIYSGCP